jgi:hypothetical protein
VNRARQPGLFPEQHMIGHASCGGALIAETATLQRSTLGSTLSRLAHLFATRRRCHSDQPAVAARSIVPVKRLGLR